MALENKGIYEWDVILVLELLQKILIIEDLQKINCWNSSNHLKYCPPFRGGAKLLFIWIRAKGFVLLPSMVQSIQKYQVGIIYHQYRYAFEFS